jgi:hypothetical protein
MVQSEQISRRFFFNKHQIGFTRTKTPVKKNSTKRKGPVTKVLYWPHSQKNEFKTTNRYELV